MGEGELAILNALSYCFKGFFSPITMDYFYNYLNADLPPKRAKKTQKAKKINVKLHYTPNERSVTNMPSWLSGIWGVGLSTGPGQAVLWLCLVRASHSAFLCGMHTRRLISHSS